MSKINSKKSPKQDSKQAKTSPSKKGLAATPTKKQLYSPISGSREAQEANSLAFKIESLCTFEDIGTEFIVQLEFDKTIIYEEIVVATEQDDDLEWETVKGAPLPKESLHVQKQQSSIEKSAFKKASSFFSGQSVLVNINDLEQAGENTESQDNYEQAYDVHYRFDPTDLAKMCDIVNECVVVNVRKKNPDYYYPSECILDIAPLLLKRVDSMTFVERLQPAKDIPVFKKKSWCNLPLITIEVTVHRHSWNELHDELLRDAIMMELRVIGICNAPALPKNSKYALTMVVPSSTDSHIETLVLENPTVEKYNPINGKYKWLSLHNNGKFISEYDRKIDFDILEYVDEGDPRRILNTVNAITSETDFLTWNVVFRTLILPNLKNNFKDRLKYFWPFILSILTQEGNKTSVASDFRGLGNLHQLLIPGQKRVIYPVVLDTITISTMALECGLFDEYIVDELSSKCVKPVIPHDKKLESTMSMNTSEISDETSDKIILFLEVELSKCLFDIEPEKPIPPDPETLKERLKLIEAFNKVREDGNNITTWKSIVDRTCTIISSQVLFGTADFCALTKYLCNTPFWAELKSVIMKSAAKNIADMYYLDDYVYSKDDMQELLRKAGINLTRMAFDALYGREGDATQMNRELKAARHAKKQMHFKHARELLMLCLARDQSNARLWRELGTHLRTTCRSTAIFCFIRSLELEPRNPLSLLCLGTAVYEEDMEAAEPFFFALLQFHPDWAPGLIATHCYLNKKEMFEVAGMIVFLMEDNVEQFWTKFTSYLGGELDDWWSLTGLSSSSIFIRTADLLLRLRACDLAEVCLSRELVLYGESPEYLFMLALSRAVHNEPKSAIRVCQLTCEKYGDIGFIKTLETQCKNLIEYVEMEFGLEGALFNAYRLPSAYNWSKVAKALRIANRKLEAELVAIHALRIDRTEKTAWQELARAVVHQPERFKFYLSQADKCADNFECFCDFKCEDELPPVPSLYK